MKKLPKVKPGVIRFTPVDNRLMESPPTVNSISQPPQWFRQIGKHQGSLRKCAGTIDFLSAGVTLPAWTNFRFRPDGHGGWEHGADEFSPEAGIANISGFGYESTGECPMTSVRKLETGQYPKIVNPWRFETAPGWSTMILPVYWEPNENYTVVPAVVHTDFYHLANVVLNITTDRAFGIKHGTPLVQLVPFKRNADFEKIDFNDESYFKYVATTGFGMGHVAPHDGTAAPYRRERIRIDKQLEDQNDNRGIIARLINKQR